MWVTNMDQYSSKGHKYALANRINSSHSHELTELTYLVTDMDQHGSKGHGYALANSIYSLHSHKLTEPNQQQYW